MDATEVTLCWGVVLLRCRVAGGSNLDFVVPARCLGCKVLFPFVIDNSLRETLETRLAS